MNVFITAVVGIVAYFIGYFSRNKQRQIPFNRERAKRHVLPLTVLLCYIDEFKRRRIEAAGSQICFNDADIADSETYNRDAIIALLNAPGAEYVSINYGIKNNLLTTCLLALDKDKRIIEARLLDRSHKVESPSTHASEPATEPEGAPQMKMFAMAAAKGKSEGEGLDDSQRQP